MDGWMDNTTYLTRRSAVAVIADRTGCSRLPAVRSAKTTTAWFLF